MKLQQNLAIIGVGKMDDTLIKSLINKQVIEPKQIFGTTSREETALKIKEKHQIHVGVDNQKAVSRSDIIILAIKPQMIKKVLPQILPELNEEKMIISIAAAISTGFIKGQLNKSMPVIRAVPNTASLVNEGMTVLCPG